MHGDRERDFIERQTDREISRRAFARWATKAGFSSFALASVMPSVLAACSSEAAKAAKTTAPGIAGTTGTTGQAGPAGPAADCEQPLKGSNDNLRFGVVGIFSGPGAFVGRIVEASLNAAVAQINKGGGVGGRKVEWIKKDAGVDPTAGVKIYNEFASSPDVSAVLWAGAPGLDESREQIRKDGMPIMSFYNDQYSLGRLYEGPGTAGEREIFQFVQPDIWAHEVALRYAKEDRGYRSAAHMYDAILDTNGITKTWFERAAEKVGIKNAGSETFQLVDTEYGQQLQRLRSARPDVVYIDGLSQNTAAIAQSLQALGAEYRDRDAVLGPEWHPHIFGSPGGTGERTWADLAGDAAKSGTITAWHAGGLIYLPEFSIRQWMKEFGIKEFPTGGEELPADGLYTAARAIEDAQCLDREAIIKAVESGGRRKFASVDYEFTETSHLARTIDDLIVVVLEKNATPVSTDPPYALGREFKDVFPGGYTGPTHLVRPTLEANTRRYPDVMKTVIEQGFGTQCTKNPAGKVGVGVTMTKDCKIH